MIFSNFFLYCKHCNSDRIQTFGWKYMCKKSLIKQNNNNNKSLIWFYCSWLLNLRAFKQLQTPYRHLPRGSKWYGFYQNIIATKKKCYRFLSGSPGSSVKMSKRNWPLKSYSSKSFHSFTRFRFYQFKKKIAKNWSTYFEWY